MSNGTKHYEGVMACPGCQCDGSVEQGTDISACSIHQGISPVAGGRLLDALVNLARLVADNLRGAAGHLLLAHELGLHHVLLLHRPAGWQKT